MLGWLIPHFLFVWNWSPWLLAPRRILPPALFHQAVRVNLGLRILILVGIECWMKTPRLLCRSLGRIQSQCLALICNRPIGQWSLRGGGPWSIIGPWMPRSGLYNVLFLLVHFSVLSVSSLSLFFHTLPTTSTRLSSSWIRMIMLRGWRGPLTSSASLNYVVDLL